jgi:hypothetical protein
VVPREEGVPDAARDGRVGGERLVEGGLVLPAVTGLERLVEEAGAINERTKLIGGGAVAGDLVLRRAEVGHGACARSGRRAGRRRWKRFAGLRRWRTLTRPANLEIIPRTIFACSLTFQLYFSATNLQVDRRRPPSPFGPSSAET